VRCMRTTLTLDPDVAAEIERIRGERGLSLREVVNAALRIGLAEQRRDAPTPFITRVVSLGRPRMPNVDDIADALEYLEDAS